MPEADDFTAQSHRWDRWAPFYDDDSRGHLQPDEAVDTLATIAGTGPVLELGIGSGRLALPLAKRGLRVDGVDAAPQMIELLHAAAGDLPIRARVTDMAQFDTGTERYRLVFVAASTLFLLGTQQRQVSCFRSVAAALAPGGRFLVEAAVPTTVAGPPVALRHLDDHHVRVSLQTHDPVEQVVRSQELQVGVDGRWRMLPSVRRYASPAELDLMADLAGLHCQARYGSWSKTPFTASSTRHVSVYGAAANSPSPA